MTNLPTTNKSLGQHWLTDAATLQSIAASAEVTTDDTVLEIGPGPGALTRLLVKQAKQVVAVEFDDMLAARLRSLEIAKNLEIVSQDILSFDLTTLPNNYKVVANIPYYLTSKLIRVLSESANPAKTAVLLIQKEVAERVAAETGDMSILSVSAQYYWDVSLGIEVPAKMFTPPPKVDSQVLIMHRRAQPLFTNVDSKQFFQVVKAGFSARRKTLLNALSGGLRLTKQETNELLAKASINPGARAQELSLEDWHELYLARLS
jgi:16S rRNA (adenine1518-N6/adenine1519-N6)-dimethyltransferase